MEKTGGKATANNKDARWPFVMLYLFMWTGMIMTSLNTDPIKLEYSIALVVGFAVVLGIVIFLVHARWRSKSFFAFQNASVLGNLAWHLFLMTGIVFISFLFFTSVVQIMVLSLGVPVFDQGCAVSQRDTALFVWDAMAKGAFKFLAKYLNLPAEACAPNMSDWTVTITAQAIRWFTALVVVWYAISLGKAWVTRKNWRPARMQ
jgi:hypothetical protein